MHIPTPSSRLTTALFIIYLIAVCWIVVFKFNLTFPDPGNQIRFNPIPYYKPLRPNGQLDYGEIVMNVFSLFPWESMPGRCLADGALVKNCSSSFW